MPIPTQSQIGGEQQTAQAIAYSVSTQMRVAMPGIIQSFDPVTVTCTVLPAIKGSDEGIAGKESANLPLLVDVPVVFPRGGGCTLTFPVKEGDECLLIFADRCIDFWWQSGGVQESIDPRQHDLSDAFAMVGPQSQVQKISNISASTAQLRSNDGSTYFELDPATQKIKIVAPGGLELVTPMADFSEQVTVRGLLSWMGGMVGSITDGLAAKITGAIEFFGSLKSNGKSIDDTHTHNGVQSGSGNSGGVN